MVPRLVGEGEGPSLRAAGVRCRVDSPRAPGCPRVAQMPSPAESRAPLIASRRCPPVQGIAPHPGFWGANVPGRAEPSPGGVPSSRGGGQHTPAPSFLRVRLLPGRMRVPGVSRVPHSQPVGAERDGRSIPAGIGLGGLFSCGGIGCWARRGPSSGGLSRYGAIICWLQLFSPLVTGPVWAAGHVLESPRVPGAIGEWGRWLCLSLHGVNSSRPGSCAAAPPVPARGTGTAGLSYRVPWPLPGAGAVPLSRLGGDKAVGPVGPAVLRRGGCTL